MTIHTEKIVTEYGLQADDFFRGVHAINEHLGDIVKNTKKVERETTKSSKKWIISYIDLRHAVRDVTRVVAGLGKAFVDLAERGGRFEKMIRGQTVEVETASKALKGLVSNYDLIQQSNMAVAFGVASTGEQFAKLTSLAAVTAQKLGIDVHDATSRVIRGVGKMEVELLDELGIRVRLNEALDMHAKKLGKTKGALSQTERQTALLNDVLEKLEHNAAGASVQVDTLGDAFKQLKIAMTDGADGFGLLIGKSGLLFKWISSLTQGLKDFIHELKRVRSGAKSDAVEGELLKLDRQIETVQARIAWKKAQGPGSKALGWALEHSGVPGMQDPANLKRAKEELRALAKQRDFMSKLHSEAKAQERFEKDFFSVLKPEAPPGGPAGKGKKAKKYFEAEDYLIQQWFQTAESNRSERKLIEELKKQRLKRRKTLADWEVTQNRKKGRAADLGLMESRDEMERDKAFRASEIGAYQRRKGDVTGQFGGASEAMALISGGEFTPGFERYVDWMHEMSTSTNEWEKGLASAAGMLGEIGNNVIPLASNALFGLAKAWGDSEVSAKDAMKATLSSFLDAMGQKMMLYALEQAAMSIRSLAMLDFAGAGIHAAAAVAFGAAATAAGYGAGYLAKSKQKKKKAGVDRGMGRSSKTSQGGGTNTFVYNINTITPPDPDAAATFVAGTLQHAKNMGINLGI